MVVSAHRFAWALTHATRSVPLNVCHRCDVPACCNPSHFFLGSDKTNNADRDAKGRQAKGQNLSARRIGRMPRGIAHHANRLTPENVRAIRSIYAQGSATWKELATQFGVSNSAIQSITERRTWKWLD